MDLKDMLMIRTLTPWNINKYRSFIISLLAFLGQIQCVVMHTFLVFGWLYVGTPSFFLHIPFPITV